MSPAFEPVDDTGSAPGVQLFFKAWCLSPSSRPDNKENHSLTLHISSFYMGGGEGGHSLLPFTSAAAVAAACC